MNKSEKIILYLIIIIGFMIATVLIVNSKKEVDYYCRFLNYDGTYDRWYVVQDYKVNKNTIEIYRDELDVWEVDRTKIKIMCIEMEEIK